MGRPAARLGAMQAALQLAFAQACFQSPGLERGGDAPCPQGHLFLHLEHELPLLDLPGQGNFLGCCQQRNP